MNMFKKNGGFTLVELIVVIAILAILAGVAVPMYSGYISKANEAADMTLLDSVKTAVVFSVTEKDPGATINSITVTEKNVTEVVVDVTESAGVEAIEKVDISAYVDDIDFTSDNNTANWTAANPKWELSKVPAATNPPAEGGETPEAQG